MENRVFGNLLEDGLEVIEREGRHFVRYDAGAHQIAWREDEITSEEFVQIKGGGNSQHQAIVNLQRRLELAGVNPFNQNWVPSSV